MTKVNSNFITKALNSDVMTVKVNSYVIKTYIINSMAKQIYTIGWSFIVVKDQNWRHNYPDLLVILFREM